MIKQQYQNLTNLSKIHRMLTTTNLYSMPTIKDLPVHNLLSITSYLNEDQLTELMLALSKCEHFHIWLQIIKNQLLFTQYIDKADKSYYFAIFQHQRYRQLHLNTVHHAGLDNNTLLHNFTNLFQIGIKKLGNSVNYQIKSEFQESVKLLFLDPPMPMPKLLRQTVAPRVCSPFQNFLLSQVQTTSETPSEPTFQILAQSFQNEQQKHLAQIANNHSQYQNIFYNAHKISFRKTSLAQLGSTQTEINLYNFLVGLFQMTDLYLSSMEQFLCSLSDQFQLYLQLVARFSVFTAFVIAVQEAFGIIFKGFQSLYRQIFYVEDSFSFWKPALSIWLSKMYKFHNKTNKVQQSLTQHLLKLHLQQKLNQQKYIQIFSTFQIHLLSNVESQQQHKNSPFFDILASDPSQLLILVNSYQEMMMDLSIDEINVLSCGHSSHQIEGAFQQIQASAIQEQSFVIAKAFKLSMQHYEKKELINQILIQRLNYLEQFLKPTTHSKIQKLYLGFLQKLPINHSKMVIDYQISRYLCYIEETKGYILERIPKSIWDLAFGPEINMNYGNKICNADTLDTENQILDNSFQFYESDNQEDISQKVITKKHEEYNFEERLARSQ